MTYIFYFGIIILIGYCYNCCKPNPISKQSDNKFKENILENNHDKVIVMFHGSKYDITDFIKIHPGGKSILYQNNGNDVEKLMLQTEHSEHAYKILSKYKIEE